MDAHWFKTNWFFSTFISLELRNQESDPRTRMCRTDKKEVNKKGSKCRIGKTENWPRTMQTVG